MKNLLTPALAIALMAAPAFAADPEPATDSDWARLDREIGALASSVNRAANQTSVGGLVRAFYARSSDDAFELDAAGDEFQVNSGNQLGGFLLKDIDVFAEGAVNENYSWRISFDLDEGSDAWLEDGWARVNCGSGVQFLAGNFKSPVLQSNRVAPENLLFADRTFIGQIFDVWDAGAMATGTFGPVRGFLAAQNGFDNAAEDMLVSSRVELSLNGGTGMAEGAQGSDAELAATLGLMWLKDESDVAEGDAFGGDVGVTAGLFSFHGEVVHFDGELLADSTAGTTRLSGNDFFGQVMIPINYAEVVGAGFETEDATLWNSSVSVMLDALDLEIGARLEVYDDPGNTRSATVGANWYRSQREVVWHAGVTQVRSNEPAGTTNSPPTVASQGLGDATLIQVGLSVGITTTTF